MNKNDIEAQAEREAQALRKQGHSIRPDERRIRQATNYNRAEFEKLFRESKKLFQN